MATESELVTKITTPGTGTITSPRYTYEIAITATSGGGGGGRAVSGGKGTTNGGGGASGSLIIKTLSMAGLKSISYTVGSGGSASSGSGGTKGGDTSFTYNGITYNVDGEGGGGDGGPRGTAVSPTDGDTNTAGNNGASPLAGGAGGASVSSDGYGAGGDGSTSTIVQNNTDGGDGGIVFSFKVSTPTATVPSGRAEISKIATIGGNRVALIEDSATGKSRIQAAIADSSILLSDTNATLPLGGMPLALKQAPNGNYVIHVYAIDDATVTYPPYVFEQSTDATMFRGVNIDTFVANDGKRVFAFDRLEDQEDAGFGKLNSNDSVKNTIVWLGVPVVVNDKDVFVVSVSNSSVVDEFVTTNFMGFPFLIARQGSEYLLCALFDDYGHEIEATGLNS